MPSPQATNTDTPAPTETPRVVATNVRAPRPPARRFHRQTHRSGRPARRSRRPAPRLRRPARRYRRPSRPRQWRPPRRRARRPSRRRRPRRPARAVRDPSATVRRRASDSPSAPGSALTENRDVMSLYVTDAPVFWIVACTEPVVAQSAQAHLPVTSISPRRACPRPCYDTRSAPCVGCYYCPGS